MNDAKQQLDDGNLKGAIESALHLVKTNPTNQTARTFLFELSCFSGDWERAERQLEVVGHQDTNTMMGAMIYRQNFKAERDRARFFADGLKPEFLLPPPAYVEDLFAANNRLREGNAAEARQILDETEENRPAFACRVNDVEFSDFRDYNDSTMCVFEAILKDQYVWLPLEQVQKIEFFKPKSLRDLYWIQAQIELTNGTNGEMFIPALYADSWKSDDDRVRLGRMTDWREAGEELYIGEGTKLYWMDGKEKSILEIQTIEFDHEKNEG
jgi:type VI secretion system protein ImpE